MSNKNHKAHRSDHKSRRPIPKQQAARNQANSDVAPADRTPKKRPPNTPVKNTTRKPAESSPPPASEITRPEFEFENDGYAKIRVLGVGGGGSNAVDRMVDSGINGVDYIAINTDAQALELSKADIKLHIGARATRGLGAGGNPNVGAQAAEESAEDIFNSLDGSDMVFITAGMGGGTGTGASPVAAQVARQVGALTIGVVTRPFMFEGNRKNGIAMEGIDQLKEHVDTLIVIPNDRLLENANQRLSLIDSFKLADDVLRQGIQGISELITTPGLINLDFADVKTVMSMGGAALMAVGHGSGEDRAIEAATAALASPMLDITIDGARGILFNVTGGSDMSLYEINQAASVIRETAHPDVNLFFGAVVDDKMEDKMRITVIATGFDHSMTIAEQQFGRAMRASSSRDYANISAGSHTESSAGKKPVGPKPTTAPQRENKPSRPVQQPRMIGDDLDIPAFLRKRK